jgi:putative endonuclease
LFFSGAVLRVVAVCQIGLLGFKFDITFRAEQKIKTDQLYGLMRHPSYTAMMIVVLAYAVTTNSWLAGILGLASAWFGFQFRIHFEEAALLEQFGDEYAAYRGRTAMWLPLPGGGAQASDSRRQLGQEGERAAVEFLKKRGYRILQTNCRSSIGEIDIVAEHESVLVFIEVKTRTTSEFGHPFTAVTPAKQRKLAQLARGFLAKHKIQNRDCRFDVVGILGSDPKTRTIELLPNAFRCAP